MEQEHESIESSREKAISEYLRERFNPEAAILVGSQVDGSATDESDWDVFLFCGDRRPSITVEHGNEAIDVNFALWPKEDSYLDTQFGPVWPAKVLIDESGGRLEGVLRRTEEAYHKGPQIMQKEDCDFHLKQLDRALEKLGKHQVDEAMSFYYKGKLYNLFLQIWFEQQNRWMPSPAVALRVIHDDDPEIGAMLGEFINAVGGTAVQIAQNIAKRLK